MLWQINKIISKGDYLYAIIPEHPKATKNHYVLLHRAIMENTIGRLLTDDEVVHHKDGNKKNNSIENLELINKNDHIRLHRLKSGKKTTKLKCPWCGKEFVRYTNETFLQKPSKYNCTCCSVTCGRKLHRYIQLHGISIELKERINSNVIDNYRSYREI